MDAAVIFTNETEHWLATRLHRGFRHVFCALPSPHDDGTSVLLNLTTDGLHITPVAGTPAQLCDHYLDMGLVALNTPFTPEKRPLLPLVFHSCVGLTKWAIGCRGWAITPWQLYRQLEEQERCGSISPSPA